MGKELNGWISGLMGVLIFSGTLPATRVAVATFDPVFFTLARATISGMIALVILILMRQTWPARSNFRALLVVAIGVVIGFPLLTALALKHVSSAHATVFIGLLPITTVIFSVLLGAKNPHWLFWLFSVSGSVVVIGFALGNGVEITLLEDALMLFAVIICGLGYAEGARLAQHLGGWQVICWALVLALPLMLPLSVWTLPSHLDATPWSAWIGLSYVTLFSMLLGFFFWYHGLARGGVAAVSQLQLLQPFFSLGLAALLLGEQVTLSMFVAALAVALCVVAAKRYASAL